MKNVRIEMCVKWGLRSLIGAFVVAASQTSLMIQPAAGQEGLPTPPPPPSSSPDEDGGDFAPPADFGGNEEAPSAPSAPSSLPNAPAANAPAPGKRVPSAKDLVSIDFPEPTAIKDIIKAVGQWTGKNFILPPNITTKVAIISPQQVTKEEAYQAFLSALNVAGFTTVETGKVVKIVPTNRASGANIKTYYSPSWAPMTDEVITQIIPLRYIDAQTVTNQLRNILRESGAIPFPTTNSIIVTDTGHKIRRLLSIITLLDVKGNQPQAAIIPIRNSDVNDITKKIQDIFTTRGSSLYLQKIIPDERTNSVILLGPPRGLDDVVRLIRRLDRPLEDSANQAQIHVRPLDFAEADKLAATLQALTQSPSSRARAGAPLPLPARPANAPALPNTGVASVADLGGVKVTADKTTNSLIIQGSKTAFREIDNIIRLLDKRRDQVYLEADIIDVSLGNDFSYQTSVLAGVSLGSKTKVPIGWKPQNVAPFAITKDNATADDAARMLGAIPATALLGLLGGGQSINIGGVNVSPGAFIFAIKNDTNSNVLQTPSMLVANNEQAKFEVTDREYVPTMQTDPTTKVMTQKDEAVDATLSLDVKPQISKSDFINMDLTIQADGFGRRAETGKPLSLNKRRSQTKVTVQNEQTVVISGLTRDVEIDGKSKVPLLGDLPILGWLFRNTSTTKQKTTLTFFLTPHIVRNSDDLAKIYDKKVRERDEFLKAFYGADFRKREVFKRMPGLDRGKTPPPPPPEVQNPTDMPEPMATPFRDNEIPLPSEDPNPIIAPSAGGSAGGPGVFGGGFDDVGGNPPPPPLPPGDQPPPPPPQSPE